MPILCTYFSLLLCFSPLFSLHFSSLHWCMQTFPSVKSILIYPRLRSTLRYQTEFSSPSFNFVFLYLRNILFQKPWFLVYKNAEEEASGKQYCNIFQAAIWGIRDLTKISGGFWHLTSFLPRTPSISPHSATYLGASIKSSKLFKKWEKWTRPRDNKWFYFKTAALSLEEHLHPCAVYFNQSKCAYLDFTLGKILTKTTLSISSKQSIVTGKYLENWWRLTHT